MDTIVLPLGATYRGACELLFLQLWICLPGIARRTSPVVIRSAIYGFVDGARKVISHSKHYIGREFVACQVSNECHAQWLRYNTCENVPTVSTTLPLVGSNATSTVSLAGG